MIIARFAIHAALALIVAGVQLQIDHSDNPDQKATAMSDREQNGLRGRVKSFTEETTLPAVTYEAGSRPEIRMESTTEYDPDGHTLSRRHRNSDGSHWVTRFTYDASGRLLKTASGNEDKGLTETNYFYDQQGRLQKIVDSQKSDNPISFLYDEHGRKSKIETSRAADYIPNLASGVTEFESLGGPPNLPGGGTATTFYDEQDRAVEIEVRNEKGELVQRAARNFDDHGHVVDQKITMEDAMPMLPPDALAKITEESGLFPDQVKQELRAQLAKFLGGQPALYSVAYEYDALGRVSRTRRSVFNRTEEIEARYNEQGDVESEITKSTQAEDDSAKTPAPEYSEVRHSYRYDERGNWIEHSVSSRSTPDGTFEFSTVTKRTLTYY